MAIEMSSGFCACSGLRDTNKPGRCVPLSAHYHMKWANMVEMAVGLGAVSRPLKGAVINIFTMPYVARCPSVLTPLHTHKG